MKTLLRRYGFTLLLVLAATLTVAVVATWASRRGDVAMYREVPGRLAGFFETPEVAPESAPKPSPDAAPNSAPETPTEDEEKPPDPAAERQAALEADTLRLLAEQTKRIEDRSLFVPKPQPQLNVKLIGILGDTAHFADGKSAKVGGNVGGAEILDMGTDWVDLKWNEQTIKQWVFGPRPLAAKKAGDKTGAATAVTVNPREVPVPEGWAPSARILERLRALEETVRTKVLEQYPDEAKRMIEEQL